MECRLPRAVVEREHVPAYQGLAELERLADEISSLPEHGEHILAVLLNTEQINSQLDRTDGGLRLTSADVDVLTDYTEQHDKRQLGARLSQMIGQRDGFEVNLHQYESEDYLFGERAENSVQTPGVILYMADSLRTELRID